MLEQKQNNEQNADESSVRQPIAKPNVTSRFSSPETKVCVNGSDLFDTSGVRQVSKPAEFVITDLFGLTDDEIDAVVNFLLMFKNRQPLKVNLDENILRRR